MAARFFVLALFCAACATSNSSSQPATAPARDPNAAPSEDELSQAFDPEREKPKEEVKPPPPPPDPAATFKAAFAEAQAAFKAKDLDRARAQGIVAVRESAALDGESRFQAHQLAFKLANQDAASAEAAATAWRLACGPEKADACRGAALSALASVARMKDADKQLGKQVKELQDAEVCAAKAEKGAPKNPCEPTAVRVSQRDDDTFIATRVLLGQALREDAEGRQVALLEKTVKSCDKPQCAGLRRKALGKLIAHARAKNDVDGAVKYALEEVKVIAASTPEPLRVYARTPMIDQTCVSYDTAHGAGSCRALEKQLVGFWTFHDYSKTPASGPSLSADQVRMVNDHYAPLLQECLADQAKRMIPPDAQRFEVRWLVFNDGRVGEAHLRKDLDQWPLAKCLRAQFGAWRYPRYEGEFQHVQQSFTVTAVEKRQLR